MSDPRLAPPPLGLLALEGRAWLEFLALGPALPWLENAPEGDGHPVLVLPGFLATDLSTRPLRWFLRRRGYHVHGWGLGRNLGPTPDVIEGLAKRLVHLRQRHGRRLSLIGWSLGGIYARELARHFFDDVRQVVTLASPFRDPAASTVDRFMSLTRRDWRVPAEIRDRLRTPPPVPLTSIFSRSDGVVAWQSCLEDEGPARENIEVWSSHCGIGHHPASLAIIADRLAQPEGTWRPLRPLA
jgi:pimeloyl-ACP methyl ester carboxylesterase